MNIIKTIIRYLKLLKAFSIFSIQDQMAYPINFWLAIAMKFLRVGIVLIFFQAIYLKVNNISGWSFGDTVFIFATFSLVDFIANVTFARNFGLWFSRMVQNGKFDYQIIKPANLQFCTAFIVIDFMDMASIVPIGALYWYALSQMSVSVALSNAVIYLILLANAVIFIYALMLALAAINFWTIQSYGLWKFAQGIIWMSRYPSDIYSGAWKIAFNFILPIAFVATWPAKAFLGILSWQNTVYALVFTIIFFWLANRFWNYGLKYYSSASS
jgi:ABC-2 type transport system permease protein